MPKLHSADIALEEAYGFHDLEVSLLFLTPQSASQILIFSSLQLTYLCPMERSVFSWLPFNLSCSCIPHFHWGIHPTVIAHSVSSKDKYTFPPNTSFSK